MTVSPAPSADASLKKKLRIAAKARRARFTEAERCAAARQLAAFGLDFLDAPHDKTIAGYSPLASEIDPRPLLTRLAGEGYRLALPAVVTDHILRFRAWVPGMALQPGPHGTLAPPASAPLFVPDIVLVPLLAFDAHGRRLGYGGGYYDATLQALSAASGGGLITVGLAYDEQECEELPQEAHDALLDWLLTPSGPRNFVARRG